MKTTYADLQVILTRVSNDLHGIYMNLQAQQEDDPDAQERKDRALQQINEKLGKIDRMLDILNS